MKPIYHIVTTGNNRGFVTSGHTRLNIPLTISSMIFLPKVLEHHQGCQVQEIDGSNCMSLDFDPFKIYDNDVYLFKEFMTREKKYDHYRQYLRALKDMAEAAASFYKANAYEIQFPSALYSKHKDTVEELLTILSNHDTGLIGKGIKLTQSAINIGRSKLLPLLFKNKRDIDLSDLEAMIKGRIALIPQITFYNITLSEPQVMDERNQYECSREDIDPDVESDPDDDFEDS